MIYSSCDFKIKAFPPWKALILLKERYSSGDSGLGIDDLKGKATGLNKGGSLIGI